MSAALAAALVAALAGALAIVLGLPAAPRLVRGRLRLRRGAPLALVAVPFLVVVGLPTATIALGVVAAAAVGGALRLERSRRERRARAETERRVLETCEHLAGELAAGQPPGTALDRAATAWPPLLPVAEAFRVGSDVPGSLRSLAARPGAADLRLLAAAWQVAHRTGHGLSDAVDRVADGLRSSRSTRRVVQGELASARATARLVGLLPLVALAMGSGAGGDPWHFLLGTPPGLACLAGGLGVGLLGLAWIEAIARSVEGSS